MWWSTEGRKSRRNQTRYTLTAKDSKLCSHMQHWYIVHIVLPHPLISSNIHTNPNLKLSGKQHYKSITQYTCMSIQKIKYHERKRVIVSGREEGRGSPEEDVVDVSPDV